MLTHVPGKAASISRLIIVTSSLAILSSLNPVTALVATIVSGSILAVLLRAVPPVEGNYAVSKLRFECRLICYLSWIIFLVLYVSYERVTGAPTTSQPAQYIVVLMTLVGIPMLIYRNGLARQIARHVWTQTINVSVMATAIALGLGEVIADWPAPIMSMLIGMSCGVCVSLLPRFLRPDAARLRMVGQNVLSAEEKNRTEKVSGTFYWEEGR